MPQLVFRVVSQVPADATDIRDASDAGLARIDALGFRASAFRVAALVLAGLAAIVGAERPAGPARPAARRPPPRRDAGVGPRRAAGGRHPARRAGRRQSHRRPRRRRRCAEAHHLVRVVAGIAAGDGGPSGAAGPWRRRCPRAGSRWTAGWRRVRAGGDVERDGRDRGAGDRGAAGVGGAGDAGPTRGPRREPGAADAPAVRRRRRRRSVGRARRAAPRPATPPATWPATAGGRSAGRPRPRRVALVREL